MIFREHNCIFFHIVKTAGTSVENWLGAENLDRNRTDLSFMSGWDDEFGFLQHATPEILLKKLGTELFERCFRFTIVRNPFARAVSQFFYRYNFNKDRFGSFDQFVSALPELLRLSPITTAGYHCPQIRYTRLHDMPCCHEIVRFEQLPDGLKPVAERLGITRPLPFLNAERHPARGYRPVSSFYTAETARILVDVYAEDFDAFGYSTDPEAANNSGNGR
jgi:chondroitin 4-sulfotransferase 11